MFEDTTFNLIKTIIINVHLASTAQTIKCQIKDIQMSVKYILQTRETAGIAMAGDWYIGMMQLEMSALEVAVA